ncbi:MAG: MerR family transcriptional regulator [Sphingomonadaceae bacterium]|nr:MerR family transcriptional regulator [Sphingomonadaceae bacterium]
MDDVLDIREVVRRTGLTARALRFYEARGLVRPLRTHNGRRLYGAGELERINQIVALKRAGLTLAQIQRLTARRPLDLGRLIAAQLEALSARAAEIEEAKSLLLAVKSRIDRGEPVDAATFCSLIRQGESVMDHENWKRVTDRYFSEEEKAHWAERMAEVPAGFDQEGYSRQWAELALRIETALPLDPAGAEAQAFYDEWQQLLAPFKAVATSEMIAGATNFYNRMDEWQSEQKPPFSMSVWQFIQAAGTARQAG